MSMNQKERREYLLHYLLQESTQVTDKRIPASEQEQKMLLRGLLNIRMPRKTTSEFIKIQDEYLQAELAAKGIVDIADLQPIQPDLYLWQGDITRLRCGAIVNAANSQMLGCFCPNHGCIDKTISNNDTRFSDRMEVSV